MELPINVRENILLRGDRNTILNTCNSDPNWQRYCITDSNLKLWETLIRRDLPVLNNVNLQYYLSREGINTGTKLGDYIQLYKQGIKFGYNTFNINSLGNEGLQVFYILPSRKLFIRMDSSVQDRVVEFSSKIIKIERSTTDMLLLENGTVWYGIFGNRIDSNNNWNDVNFNLNLTDVVDISLYRSNFCVLFKDGTVTHYNNDRGKITELRRIPGPILSCKIWIGFIYLFDTNNNLIIYGNTELPKIDDKIKNDIIAKSEGTITKIDDTPIGFCPSHEANVPFAYIKQSYKMIRPLYRGNKIVVGDKDIAAYTPISTSMLYQDILLYTDGSIQYRTVNINNDILQVDENNKSYFQLDQDERALELQNIFFRTNKNRIYEYDLNTEKQFSTMSLPEGVEMYFYDRRGDYL